MTRAYRGLVYDVHADVYEPAEDSFLLVDAVLERDWRDRRVVELGCGAGLAAVAAARGGAEVVAVDRNPDAVALARRNARLNGVAVEALRADMVSAVRGRVDALLFNPPYLPTEPGDVPASGRARVFDAWDAGPTGIDVVMRLGEQLRQGRVRVREILLLTSSLQDEEAIVRAFRALGYDGVVEREAKVPWEVLRAWKWNLRA